MRYQNEGANLCNMTKALGSIINCKNLLVVFIKQAQVEKYNCLMWCKACQDSRMESFKLNMQMKIILDLCSYLDYTTFEISSIFLCIFLNIEI